MKAGKISGLAVLRNSMVLALRGAQATLLENKDVLLPEGAQRYLARHGSNSGKMTRAGDAAMTLAGTASLIQSRPVALQFRYSLTLVGWRRNTTVLPPRLAFVT